MMIEIEDLQFSMLPLHTTRGGPSRYTLGTFVSFCSSVSTLGPSTGTSHCQGDGGGLDLSMIIMTYISRQNSIFP